MLTPLVPFCYTMYIEINNQRGKNEKINNNQRPGKICLNH